MDGFTGINPRLNRFASKVLPLAHPLWVVQRLSHVTTLADDRYLCTPPTREQVVGTTLTPDDQPAGGAAPVVDRSGGSVHADHRSAFTTDEVFIVVPTEGWKLRTIQQAILLG
jgi:hypothetical protein